MSRKVPTPEHGTPARYLGTRTGSRPPCGCRKCVDAHTRACSLRAVARAAGNPPRVPTRPVTEHVHKLLTAGMSCAQIAIAADVSRSSVCNAANSKNPTFNRAVANKILTVRPRIVRDTDRLPIVGTRRRLQALYAIGHGALSVSQVTGMSPYTIQKIVNESHATITASTYKKVRAAYRQLVAIPGVSARAKASARTGGWPAPAAWGDDIDNPAATPDIDGVERELSRDELAALRRTEIEHLEQFNLSEHEIADRLGMAYTSVRNIVLEIRSGTRRVRPREGAAA